jgi:hypothetical protein
VLGKEMESSRLSASGCTIGERQAARGGGER